MNFKYKLIIIFQLILFWVSFILVFQNIKQYWLIGLLLCVIFYLLNKKYNKKDNTQIEEKVGEESIIQESLPFSISEYIQKPLLTRNEISFYNKIKSLNDKYIIVPQVNLASIIDKTNSKYRSELFRNIDFGVFDKEFNLLLLIELNDASHEKYNRQDRDLKIKKILNDCNIKIIYFYTKYPNEKEYVLKRIESTINKSYVDNNDISE